MNFMLGCNYWASNAGTEMWRNWDEDAVRDDFRILKEHNVEYLRVFPNWRDFQPVSPLFDQNGFLREYRVHEDKVPQNKYYLDETMMQRFGKFCDIAEEFGMKLIVGILTGWMSGRLFIPPALYGKHIYTDNTALMFELKFIKGFVERFKNKKSIYAWNLGNETNCMAEIDNHEIFEVWTGFVCNAIRANDNTRPVISGMHGLSCEGKWRIEAQGEYTDMLTTHPYPYFVPHCSMDRFCDMRTLLHATTESKYYADISGKPCLVEEIGTLGPCMCDDEMAKNFLKVNMFSNWAHGMTGVIWWCANEQIMLENPPYDWNMLENELGMIDKNRNPKPILTEMRDFSDWLKTIDFELPKANEDGVCILSEGLDHWGCAYMSYILAKQAKVNFKFVYAKQELPESDFYMLPSVNSVHIMPKHKFNELIKRVENGATLYISNDDSFILEFKYLTGNVINDTQNLSDSGEFELNGKKLEYSRIRKFTITPENSKVLATDKEGMALVTEYQYGKGKVYYVNFPLETRMLGLSNCADSNQYEVYRTVFADKIKNHAVDSTCKYIGITEHYVNQNELYVVMVNYSGFSLDTELMINNGYKVEKVIRGSIDEIAPFETVILKLNKD